MSSTYWAHLVASMTQLRYSRTKLETRQRMEISWAFVWDTGMLISVWRSWTPTVHLIFGLPFEGRGKPANSQVCKIIFWCQDVVLHRRCTNRVIVISRVVSDEGVYFAKVPQHAEWSFGCSLSEDGICLLVERRSGNDTVVMHQSSSYTMRSSLRLTGNVRLRVYADWSFLGVADVQAQIYLYFQPGLLQCLCGLYLTKHPVWSFLKNFCWSARLFLGFSFWIVSSVYLSQRILRCMIEWVVWCGEPENQKCWFVSGFSAVLSNPLTYAEPCSEASFVRTFRVTVTEVDYVLRPMLLRIPLPTCCSLG